MALQNHVFVGGVEGILCSAEFVENGTFEFYEIERFLECRYFCICLHSYWIRHDKNMSKPTLERG